jgi:hypothetical protein
MGTSWVEGGEIRYISDLTQLFQRFLNHNAFFFIMPNKTKVGLGSPGVITFSEIYPTASPDCLSLIYDRQRKNNLA